MEKQVSYQEFLQRKRHSIGEFGFDPVFMPEMAFDFQKYVIEKSVRKGRIANFLDTGLGKTLIQLSIAQNIAEKTNRRVLILTPLAVAFQFILEAEKIGIELKDSYFKQMGLNMKDAKSRFKEEPTVQFSLF